MDNDAAGCAMPEYGLLDSTSGTIGGPYLFMDGIDGDGFIAGGGMAAPGAMGADPVELIMGGATYLDLGPPAASGLVEETLGGGAGVAPAPVLGSRNTPGCGGPSPATIGGGATMGGAAAAAA